MAAFQIKYGVMFSGTVQDFMEWINYQISLDIPF